MEVGSIGNRVRAGKRAVAVAASLIVFIPAAAAALSGCAPPAPGAAFRARTEFGVMLGGAGMTVGARADLAGDLGVGLVRPWDVDVTDPERSGRDAAATRQAGFGLVLTVRNGGSGGPPPTPSSPPLDPASYGETLGEIIDEFHPALLCVENEENSSLFYDGTPEEYAGELEVAVEVAHSRGVKVTNGGLVSGLVAALVFDDLRSRGDDAGAEEFLDRAATPEDKALLTSEEGRARVEEQLEKGRELLRVYRDSGIDYVNFHWYMPDARALAQAVDFLRRATGLEPVTNEIGQHDTEPGHVTDLLEEVERLRLPFAVWYSLDRSKSRALQEPDGTLRASGEAFREYMEDR